MNKAFFGVPWWALGLAALALALVWVWVWPKETTLTPGTLAFFLVRWGHSLVWVFLGLGFLARSLGSRALVLADILAYAGGLTYLAFLWFAQGPGRS